MDFDTTVLWPVFKSAGMLRRVSIKTRIGGAENKGDVGYRAPSVLKIDGSAISQEYRIEYQAADFPKLGEGDVVTFLDDDDVPIAGMKFKVRAPSYVSENELDANDGTYRMALLTRL